MNKEPCLYLAPITGFTDAVFRKIYALFFPGTGKAVAPFVPERRIKRNKPLNFLGLIHPLDSQTGDTLETCRKSTMFLVPQILGKDPETCTDLVKKLEDLGFSEINWNLGCPSPMITRKGRGSALLAHPDRVEAFLDALLPKIRADFSVKLRLGYENPLEMESIIPLINRYPIKEVIVHPRLGRQLYTGNVDLEGFGQVLALCDHPVVYNGDINQVRDYILLKKRFPQVNRWMMGRGVLSNPFLPYDILCFENLHQPDPEENRKEVFRKFHHALAAEYQKVLFGDSHCLKRMKGFWGYFSKAFAHGEKIRKQVHKSVSVAQMMDRVNAFLDNDRHRVFPPYLPEEKLPPLYEEREEPEG